MAAVLSIRRLQGARPAVVKSFIRDLLIISWLMWLALAPAVGHAAQTLETERDPAAAAPGVVPDTVQGQTITVPGMQTPNGLAVHGVNRRIYVTSRNNGMLYMLDPSTYGVLGQASVGSLPWGVAVDHALNRVWVANFSSGTVSVLDATGLGTVATLNLGPSTQPTFVGYLPAYQRVFVALHGIHAIAVINAVNNTVERIVSVDDRGPWGLAVNPNLNRVYVTFRETATMVTLDPSRNWAPLPGHTIQPCGRQPAAPYGIAFNQNTNKLYVACAPAGNVNTAAVYYASSGGLIELRRQAIGSGGPNGGGVAVNLASGYAFFTNSAADTVSIIGHPSNQVIGQEPTGRDPFAVAVDGIGGRVIVGNRGSNNLTIFDDPYLPAAYKVNGVAVNPLDGKLFVTSRENGLLLRLKGSGVTNLESFAIVGRQPWGVAVNPRTDRVYVANFADGTMQVLGAASLTSLATIQVGGQPTFVEVDSAANRIFTVSHTENKLVVINGALNQVEAAQTTGGGGAFGLAVNIRLNRAYVSHRESRDIITMDGSNGWQPIASQRIDACGAGRSPYALAFNPTSNRLYVACATAGNVDTAVVYLAETAGLTRQATLPLGRGGADGGGGIAVNPATGNVFFTNSEAGTVSVVDGQNRLAGAPVAAGLDPFGIAADPARGYIYVGLRLGNDVVVLRDTTAPVSGPRIYLSRQQGCQGVPLTIYGTGFSPSPSGQVEVRVDGALAATVPVDPGGSFMANLLFPGPRDPGGLRTVTVYDPALPALTASAALRTPRTDLPVIFMGGIAGSQLAITQTFKYEIPPYDIFGNGEKREYKKDEQIWLSEKSIWEALFGKDAHFYPLRLAENGRDPMPDKRGRVGYIGPTEPLWELQPPLLQPKVDVYQGLFSRMQAELGLQGRYVYHFGYDWRKDINASDPLLDQKIQQVLRETGKDKVVIVAHSMGGVLARNYILKHGAGKIDQLITFGTPYLGSVHPAKYLEMGDNMGMTAPTGDELAPWVVKEMARNFGGLYQLLPGPLWFNRSPFDGNYDPRYLGQATMVYSTGGLWPTYYYLDGIPFNYNETMTYLANNYNAALVQQADRFISTGIGDLTLMTDQYINQRIIGVGTPTWGHLWMCHGTCRVCVTKGKNLDCSRFVSNIEDIPVLDTLGDDTVPLRSAAGYEPLAQMLNNGQHYFVDNARHMTLGADARVQNLVLGLLKGAFCTHQTALPPGNPLTAGATAFGLAPDAVEADYAGIGATTGVQLTLLGDARMTITDPLGRRLSAESGLMTGYANAIPGANLVVLEGAQVAALTTGGPFTVAIRGAAEASAARLTVNNLQAGAIQRTITFPGVPVTTTTAATLTLPAATVDLSAQLIYRYTPDSATETLTGSVLDGPQAGDVTAPTVHVAIEAGSGLVTITADDGPEGAGVMQVLYSGEPEPTHFTPYTGPFAWPAGSACVTGLALDRAGNTGMDRLCRVWLPLVVK